MATKLFCDRCERLIASPLSGMRLTYNVTSKDLCSTCKTDFMTWLNAKTSAKAKADAEAGQ